MAAEEMLEDYNSNVKLDIYKSVITNKTVPAVAAKYYNLYQSLPSLKDKMIFDLPCGIGIKSRKFITEYGATKVIGADIVEKQLEVAREADSKAGITSDKIQYICHDAKISLELCQADVCVAAHLFCFAENFDELVCIAKCVFVNLKAGGELCSISCSMGKESTEVIKEKYTTFNQHITHLDEQSGDIHVPRKMSSIIDGFKFEVCMWEYAAIVKALDSVGFKSVELLPYQSDPDYCGPYDLKEYIKLIDGYVVKATK